MKKRFLMVASYSESLLNFRGALLKELIASNLEVHVAAPEILDNIELKEGLENLGLYIHDIPLDRTGMNPIRDFVTFFRTLALIRKVNPDFFFAYTIKPVIYGGLAAWLSCVQNRFSLITGLGYAFQGESHQRSVLKNIVRMLYGASLSNMHKVFFQNPDDEALFCKLGILNSLDRKTVVVNGSGVDVASFKVASLPKAKKFLLIARLLGDKGVREYVEAAKIVLDKHPGVVFGLVGWIDENPDAIEENEIKEWVDSRIIKFYGHLSDVKPAISECSVYVLPSYREGTPRTVLEAMAMGRAIITTDAPGCRETVVDGKNGFLVSVRSVTELAEAMFKFIEQPDLINSMGKQSRAIAEEKYDVHKVNDHMLREMGIR